MRRTWNSIVLRFVAYPIGVCIGILSMLAELLTALRVKGWGNFPRQSGKILVVSNHPYRGEQFFLIGLLFLHKFILSVKHGPWTMADKINYYDQWWAWPLRSRLISVDRTKKLGDLKSVGVAEGVLASGGNVLVFPEGTRTSKVTSRRALFSRKGKKLGLLKSGFARLALVSGVVLVPVWVEFHAWYDVEVIIGEPVTFPQGTTEGEIVERVQVILLELADRVG
jgi:1-acyl-sn-glycerol-3-phosphate acyltransferase